MCIIKEVEILHEDLLTNRAEHGNNAPIVLKKHEQLSGVVNRLNLRTRCMCRDATCTCWSRGHCMCDGNPMCRDVSFELRCSDEDNREPTEREFAMVESKVTEVEKARLPDEPYIVWKVRVADNIYQKAFTFHNMPEDGATTYTYTSDSRVNATDRLEGFKQYVRDVRCIHLYRNLNYDKTVGCSQCLKTFFNETYLLAHVDKARTLGDTTHFNCLMVKPDGCTPVRPTPSDYRIPEPHVPEPSEDHFPEPTTHCERVATQEREEQEEDSAPNFGSPTLEHYRRDSEWNDEEWTDYLVDTVRYWREDRNYVFAVGCFDCGQVLRNSLAFNNHLVQTHRTALNDMATERRRWRVTPE